MTLRLEKQGWATCPECKGTGLSDEEVKPGLKRWCMDCQGSGLEGALAFYGMNGQKISAKEWVRTERRVAETTLSNGRYVSTVLLGIDHGWFGGDPVIFETMVFEKRKANGTLGTYLDQRRYPTLAKAKAGHVGMVKQWEAK
jgi:hypothetical protein